MDALVHDHPAGRHHERRGVAGARLQVVTQSTAVVDDARGIDVVIHDLVDVGITAAVQLQDVDIAGLVRVGVGAYGQLPQPESVIGDVAVGEVLSAALDHELARTAVLAHVEGEIRLNAFTVSWIIQERGAGVAVGGVEAALVPNRHHGMLIRRVAVDRTERECVRRSLGAALQPQVGGVVQRKVIAYGVTMSLVAVGLVVEGGGRSDL